MVSRLDDPILRVILVKWTRSNCRMSVVMCPNI